MLRSAHGNLGTFLLSIFCKQENSAIMPSFLQNYQQLIEIGGIINFMTTVKVKENEPFEVAMRRFKRSVEKTGLLTELRAREFYEKPTAERKRKLAAAVKRTYKRLRSQLLPPKLY